KHFESILLSCEDILRETKDLLSKSKKISEQIEGLYTENKSCNYNYDNNAQPSGIVFELKNFESFIPHPVEQVMDKWQILLENYEAFFEKDNSITEIFKVKKAL
ncbi:hypothetical protein OR235_002652, partial [Enterobacter cloacae]|nr:hypothetical protein [Enterobacter cloacae]